MGVLTSKGYPYPVNTETPDVPRDIKALADRINADPTTFGTGLGFGNVAAGAAPSGVITLPVGKFATPPQAAMGILCPSAKVAGCFNTVSATSLTVQVWNQDSVARAVSVSVVCWSAT